MFTRIRMFLDGGNPGTDTLYDLPAEGRVDPTPVPDPDDKPEVPAGEEGKETDKPAPEPEPSKDPADEGKPSEEGKSEEKETDSDSKDEQTAALEERNQRLEQENKRLKGIQTKYQDINAFLKEKHPEDHDYFINRRKAINAEFGPREHLKEQELQEGVDFEEDTYGNKALTIEGQRKLMGNETRKALAEEREANRRDAEKELADEMEASYQEELKDVEGQIQEFMDMAMVDDDGKPVMIDGKPVPMVPPEIWQKAYENVRPRGKYPGSPTDAFHDIMREVQLLMIQRNINQTRVKIEAQETEKVRKVKEKLSQPARAAATDGAKKSDEMEELERRRAGVTGQPMDDLLDT